uniref:FERM domain-containing protein n=1 Tax=Mesocestoides corti TaxID=53468 RepID=A0A5K3G301_MESCO
SCPENSQNDLRRQKRKQDLRIKRLKQCSLDNIARLESAVERAFDLAIRLNLPTVPGSTLIFVNLTPVSFVKLNFGKTSVSTQLLLAFMCMTVCEDFDAYIQLSDKCVYNVKEFALL